MLSSDLVLAQYDPTLPLNLAADASTYGVGAVISQKYQDNSEHAIAFASSIHTPTEQKYAQVEKEVFALVFRGEMIPSVSVRSQIYVDHGS